MSTWRSLAEKPMAALAEKYCAVTELSSPTPPSTTSHRHMRTMKPVSPEDALVDDRRHNQRDDQLKGGFQQLEQRREHTFQPEIPNINKQFFSKNITFSAIKMEQPKQIHYRMNYAIWQEKRAEPARRGGLCPEKTKSFTAVV